MVGGFIKKNIKKRGSYYKVVQYRKQTKETMEEKGLWQPTHWFKTDLPGDKQFTPRNSEEVETLLESKEIRSHTPQKVYPRSVSKWLASLINNYLQMFLENWFLKLLQNL